jgi:RimJ/RimL family protein N-acetyltransferase
MLPGIAGYLAVVGRSRVSEVVRTLASRAPFSRARLLVVRLGIRRPGRGAWWWFRSATYRDRMTGPVEIRTTRLRLRCWTDDDRDGFARMNADPEVMHDLGGPIGRADSDRKLDAYADSFDRYGYTRWLIETLDEGESHGTFVGYAGVVAHSEPGHPLGLHDEIGWRLTRTAWGHGYATEAARAALGDVFTRIGLSEVLSYTSPDNVRSQAVMRRLNLRRDRSLDFTATYPEFESWSGLVWVATAPSD